MEAHFLSTSAFLVVSSAFWIAATSANDAARRSSSSGFFCCFGAFAISQCALICPCASRIRFLKFLNDANDLWHSQSLIGTVIHHDGVDHKLLVFESRFSFKQLRLQFGVRFNQQLVPVTELPGSGLAGVLETITQVLLYEGNAEVFRLAWLVQPGLLGRWSLRRSFSIR